MRYKLAALVFALSVTAISIYGMLQPSYELGLFLGLNYHFAQVRLMIAAMLLIYTFVPAIRLKVSQISMLLCGAMLLGTGIASMVSPMLLGAFSQYMVIGDLVIAIESGVLAILIAAELPIKQTPKRTDLLMPAHHLYSLASVRLAPVKQSPKFSASSRMPKLDLIRKQTA